jgi:RNA polymerase sigma-70 factor (ECF subfamily)
MGTVTLLRAPDEVRLATRCVAGDRAAQHELFHRQKRRVHATLYRILGSNSEIDDLVQEAFLEIFRSLHTFRGEALLSTWIDRLTVRVAYAYIGRRRPEAVRLSVVPEAASHDASAESRAMAREAARRLYALLDRVEKKQRIAYTLHVIDGRSLDEVAQVMESTVVVTRMRSWRAARFIEGYARRDPLLAGFMTDEAEREEK